MPHPRSSVAAAGALVALALLLGGCASGQGSAPPSAAPTPAPSSAPAGGAPASTPASARPLARVFPGVDGATCRPVAPADGLTNSAGAAPTEAYVCDYGSTAPGAVVAFTQWADAAAARAWYDDTTRLGPRIEDFDVWQVEGVQQGALYTAQYNGQVVSTGIYDGTPYGWEIRTATLDQSNQVFGQIRFLQRSAFGS